MGKYAQDFLKIGNINPVTSSVHANRLANDIVIMTNHVQLDRSNDILKQSFLIEAYGYENLTGQIDLATDPTLVADRYLHGDPGEIPEIRQYSLELFDADGGGISLEKSVKRKPQRMSHHLL